MYKYALSTKRGSPIDDKGQPIKGRTQPDFLRRQIKLQPGQVFRDDVARTDLRRLSELGIFDGATISRLRAMPVG